MRRLSRLAPFGEMSTTARCMNTTARMMTPQIPHAGVKKEVSMFPGHGIGPELCAAVRKVVAASKAPIVWDVVDDIVDRITPTATKSLLRTRVGVKGQFSTAIGRNSLPSINVELRKTLDLYANIVATVSIPGIPCRHENVDIVMIRESTEGEYSGIEHEVVPGVTESLKIMTRGATMAIAEYAFEFAFMNNRKKVTAVHKANIMKLADGLFLESCRSVAKRYPSVQYEEIIVDNCMMQLVSRPQRFDVMVTPNFYGSLVSNGVAGLTHGAGTVPGANIGKHGALFEQGPRHVASDIAGKDLVNPTGILYSTVMMLRYLQLPSFADRIESAVSDTLMERKFLTRDIGGTATTTQYLDAVISKL